MKLKKLTSWPGKKLSRARREVKNGSPNGSPTGSPTDSPTDSPGGNHSNSEPCTKQSVRNQALSVEKEVTKFTKENSECFLFEDNVDDDINDNGLGDIKKNTAVKLKATNLQISKAETQRPMSPIIDHGAPLTSTAKYSSQPPQEIMIDLLAVPPSPMRDPNLNPATSPNAQRRLLDDFDPSMHLTFQESSPRKFGDPVGDIAMERQLKDAQRLVRIILGKPTNKNPQELGSNSILQAIRSYALMKAELMDLRKKQEVIDGDPPAILETLGSPAATTPSTVATGNFSPRRSGLDPANTRNIHDISISSALESSISSDLEQAKNTITQLQNELKTANGTIFHLKETMRRVGGDNQISNTVNSLPEIEENQQSEVNNRDHNELVEGNSIQKGNFEVEEKIGDHTNAKDSRNCTESIRSEVEDGLKLLQDTNQDQTLRQESEQLVDLDRLLDEIIQIPQGAQTKEMAREKIERYYHTRLSIENQTLEIKKKMRETQKEADMQIVEMQNKTEFQAQEHKKQIDAIIIDIDHLARTRKQRNKTPTKLPYNTVSNAMTLSSKQKPTIGDTVNL